MKLLLSGPSKKYASGFSYLIGPGNEGRVGTYDNEDLAMIEVATNGSYLINLTIKKMSRIFWLSQIYV